LIFAIDHVVFAASPNERQDAARWLESRGFQPRPFGLDFADSGVSSESWSFGGGGFVEFVVENESGAGHPNWFSSMPRVIGLGFASDDFVADTRWEGEEESWRMNEDHTLASGAVLTIEAAGPHVHAAPFYVFVMNRPERQLQFEPAEGPQLTRIELAGRDAHAWREDLTRWLSLPTGAAPVSVGGTVLEFVEAADEGLHASLIFASDVEPATYPLGAGSISVGAGV
jgi:hypothetical protein